MVEVIGDSTLGEIEESELPDGVDPEDLTPVEEVTMNLRGLFKSFGKFDDSYLVGDVTALSTNSKHLYFSIKAANGNEETDDLEKFFKCNRTWNDEKLKKLDQCLKLTAASLALVILHPVVTLV
jgi:hypothetical protein